MIIKNCKIETTYKYEKNEEEPWNKKKIEILRISISLPMGNAIYEIPISKDLCDSLDKAAALQVP